MTDIGSTDSVVRHVPAAVIEAYHEQGVGGMFVVEGTPRARIQITPNAHQLSLLVHVHANVPGPDLRDRANIAYDLQHEAGTMWHRLDVTFDDNLLEVYPVLCTIADRIQVGGETFADAVEAVLAGLGDILAGRSGLSRDEQVGLFGELVILLSLSTYGTATDAVAAWRGPDREEHDFGLPNADLEVKTTTLEGRRHWIGSLTQLVPTPNRDLYVVSLQITAAGRAPGATLAQLVDAARTLPGIPASDIDQGLERIGWRPQHVDLYGTPWTLRTAASFYRVDKHFPAITPGRVAAAVPMPERVTDIRYRVDLDGLTPANSLFPIALPRAIDR